MSEVVLPEGWIKTELKDFVFNANGARKPISAELREQIKGSFPYYGATGQIDSLNDYTHEGEHILIGEDGANLLSKSKDLAFVVNGKYWVNNHAHAVRPLAGVPSKYIANFINSLDLTSFVTGSAQPKLTKGNLEKIEIPVPPLAEQKIIAAKLDELLAQVDIIKARLTTIPKMLKRFRQSVLAAAVSGKLTEEWRGEHGFNFSDWINSDVGSVSKVATGKTPSRAENRYWDNGHIPWLTSSSTGNEYTYSAEQFVTDFAVKDCGLKVFDIGTLLLAMYGEGKTRGQVTEVMLASTCNQACAAITADESKISRAFLKLRLLENYEETRKVAAGGAQPNLNLNKVRDIPLLLPSIEEQTEIVRRVEQLFAFADQIEQQVKNAQSRVNNLTQSILAKAFRGELTADWRAANPDLITGENSAQALLAKIKAERDKPKKTPKQQAMFSE